MGKNSRNRKKSPGRAPSPTPATPPARPVEQPAASTMTLAPPPPKARPIPPRLQPVRSNGGPIRLGTVSAVFERNYFSYFSNPAGYVFITLFVAVSAWAAFWQPVFFANNLANLAPLNEWMPYLLLFFIPAITMNAWADERRLGTDELLLTLPARDVEVVLGKYLAALGIYSTALAFSLSLVAILYWLGTPDLGVVVSTYIGYWLMGVLMVAIGLVASVLSSNVTVAFILGAVFSAIPVFAGLVGSPLGNAWRRTIEDLSIPNQFRDFGTGVVPIVGVFYFLTLAGAMLYVNMVLLGRRHWAGGERSRGLGVHAFVRVVCVVAALGALDVLIGRYANLRPDLSSEGVHRLSAESLRLIGEIPADRPVYVEAYYSQDVPREYVPTKVDLLNKLREFAASSGGRIRLNLVPTEMYSPEAREAEKRFGITPRKVVDVDEGRQTASDIFLGVAFTSGPEEVVVPFFDRGLPVEYELTRSIRVVAKSSRKRLGVLQTDAKLLGGFDFRAMGQNTEWPFVSELKKQYEVSSVSADAPIPADLDVLLVAQPSSLSQRQIDNVSAHVRAGRATMLFVDPLPRVDPQLSPELKKQPPGGPFGGGPPPEEKGDLTPLLDLLGVEWPTTDVVWDSYSPHPGFEVPREVVFIGKGGAGSEAFNPGQPATSGLQEVVTLWAGQLRARPGGPEFIPLLRSSDLGGTMAWSDYVQSTMFGTTISENPNRRYRPSGRGYTLAARIQGRPTSPAPPSGPDAAKGKAEASAGPAVNAVVVADLDMISELFFNLRRQKVENLDFDNITFVLNCVDVLAGDDSFVELRKKRIRHRTLTRLEDRTKVYVGQAQAESKAAEDAAAEQLDAARKRLDENIAEISKRTDLDAQTKRVMLENRREVEQRRLTVETTNIEDAKRRKVADSKARTESEVRQIQSGVRAVAILVPPLPALLLGAFVFAVRLGRENRGANPNRLA